MKFNESFDKVILYDHLLIENGISYFNRAIDKQEIKIEDNTASFELGQHSSVVLLSSIEFLKDGAIRGLRIVTQKGNLFYECTFVIFYEGRYLRTF